MAYYAFLNSNNIVIEVIKGKDENENNVDWEKYYEKFRGMPCKRTSYNTYGNVHLEGKTPFRKNYAGIGFLYDSDRDAFIPPKPYDSWILDENTCLWYSSEPYPSDEKLYKWDESSLSWKLLSLINE